MHLKEKLSNILFYVFVPGKDATRNTFAVIPFNTAMSVSTDIIVSFIATPTF
jgi:hypothetical protein